MILWGVNALNHGHSVAVFKDGQFVHNYIGTSDQLESSTTVPALGHGSPDRIFWYERPWIKKARQIYAGQYKTAMKLDVLPRRYMRNYRYAPITYTAHHASHAAAGYYTSPFNHCAIIVLDAIGEFECATIWEAKHGEMTKVWSRSYPHSLGLFYSAYTQYLGLTPIKDEHLLQKMAEQGNSRLFLNSVRQHFNSGTLNLKTNFHRGLYWDDNQLTSLQEQCDLAAAVQQVFEEQIDNVIFEAKKLIATDSLVYMGGCAMNSRANKLVVEPRYKYIWSLPNPGDPSSSIGAVAYHTKQRIWNVRWDPVKHIEIKV
jgi:carbamoyltransferase